MTNDNEEPSAASAGSVAGEPDAWMHVSGGLSLGVFKHVDPRLRHLCVPLYRHSQPMLTAAEREAVDTAEASLMRESTDLNTPLPVRQRLGAAAATLQRLLKRLG